METLKYLSDVARRCETSTDPEELNRLLDEVEFMYDSVETGLQELVDEVIAMLRQRISDVS